MRKHSEDTPYRCMPESRNIARGKCEGLACYPDGRP
jgi:hypothetical protein